MSEIVDNKKKLLYSKNAFAFIEIQPSFCQALRYGREVRKTRSREKLEDRRDLGTGWRRKKCRCYSDIGIPAFGANLLGQIFSLCFRFLTLTCYRVFFFFSLSCNFVNYAPLLRAVCKFGYSLLSPPLFFTRVLRIYQCNCVLGNSFFSRFP